MKVRKMAGLGAILRVKTLTGDARKHAHALELFDLKSDDYCI
jgi:hypothetical protein